MKVAYLVTALVVSMITEPLALVADSDVQPDATLEEEPSAESLNGNRHPPSEVEEIEEIEVVEEIDVEEAGSGVLASEFDGIHAIRRDRGVNILTARPIRKKSFALVVDHRAFKNLFEGEDAFFDFLGLDGGGLKIGLGLRYGILDDLDVGFYRLNNGNIDFFDTYEFDARWRFLRQDRHFIDMSVRAGYTWFAQKNRGDASGFLGQVFINRIFFDVFLVGAGFAFHSESSNDEKANADDAYSGAVTAVLEWRILNWLALTGEIGARVLGYGSDWPAFSMAVKFLTHRHSFTILLTNSQYTAGDGIVANSWRTFDDLIFGFQIIREFNL